MKVPVSDIIIKERVRIEIGDLSSLMQSMQDHGQLNPVTITRDNELIAGHRRLLSALELEWTYIDASIVDSCTEAEKLQLELEENVHRKDFSPEELLAGYRRLEKLTSPSITKRIANFFGNIFGKLFRRKKRNKAPEQSQATTEEQTIPAEKKPENSEKQDQEVGQYGV
jgi:ParB family chromosome partitioning protein